MTADGSHDRARRFVHVSGQALAFTEMGEGSDVVLIHGTLTCLEDMAVALGPHLSRAHRVLAFDRPGHAGSTRPPGDGSLRTQADLLVQAFAELGLRRPILVGHSAGGSLALTIAIHHPDAIGGVVALAPLVFFEPRAELFLFGPRGVPVFGPLAAKSWLRPTDALTLPLLWNAIFLPQAMPKSFAATMPFARLASSDEMIATGEDALALAVDLPANSVRYARCTVPVRILAGGADVVVSNRRQGARLPSLMPDCTYEEISGIGHMIHRFAPERVLELVGRLASVAPGGRGTHRQSGRPAAVTA